MPYIAYLSKLNTLDIRETDISAKGLAYLVKLTNLERLSPPLGLDDAGMAAICNLTSLKALYLVFNNSVTNKGLAQISKLKSLELLGLNSTNITDDGLNNLSALASLRHLTLVGNFTNEAIPYLKDIKSIKSLHIEINSFDDKGMEYVSGLTQLENFNAHRMSGITDSGIAYFKNMINLNKLDIGSSKVTDTGLSYLKDIKTINYLTLPVQGISDTGLTYLGQLTNLKHLDVSRINYVDPNMDVGYYTDKGVAELAKCKQLEELVIGSIGMTDDGMSHIGKLTNLNFLSLFGCSNVTNKGLAKLTTLKSLQNLNVYSANITIGGLSCLNELPNLTNLSLHDVRQDDIDMNISKLEKLEDLILWLRRNRIGREMTYEPLHNSDLTCLANLTKLKRLQFTGFGIDDSGLKNLAGLKNAEFINISCSGELSITDEGLKYLAVLPKLNRLIIKDGHFTDKALEYLSGMPTLTWLELTSDFAFSNKGIKSFQTKNPNVERLQLVP